MSSFDVAGADEGAANMSNGSAGGGAFASSSPDDELTPPRYLMKTPTTRHLTIPRYQTRSLRGRRVAVGLVAIRTGGRRFCRGRLVVVAVEGPRVRRDLLRTNSGLAQRPRGTRTRSEVAASTDRTVRWPRAPAEVAVDLVAHHRTERTDRKLRHAFRGHGPMARRGRLLLAELMNACSPSTVREQIHLKFQNYQARSKPRVAVR